MLQSAMRPALRLTRPRSRRHEAATASHIAPSRSRSYLCDWVAAVSRISIWLNHFNLTFFITKLTGSNRNNSLSSQAVFLSFNINPYIWSYSFQFYTVNQNKTPTRSFWDNFSKYGEILIIPSLLHSEMKCRKSYYVICHPAISNLLPHYHAKFECVSCTTLQDSHSIQKWSKIIYLH